MPINFAVQIVRLSKGLYDHCQSVDIDLHSMSQVRLKLDCFYDLQYIGQCLSYCIQTWFGGRLMGDLYVHASFDDLDLDAKSQCVGKGKKSALDALCNKQ